MTRIPAAVRASVRQRAATRCEYCRLPEDVIIFKHQVDHIISEKQGGSANPDNLAWVCFYCNNRKGTDVAAYDEISGGVLTPLYNPRTQQWSEHFEMENAVIIGKTAIGRVTIRILQMNHPKQILARRGLLNAGLW